MKSTRRFSIVVAIAVGVLSFVALTPAFADTSISPDQQKRIEANCAQIQNTLNQLHISDALLRVNRGQFYESMGSKLMDRFNTRLANNGMDNKNFVSVSNDYDTILTTFRTDYVAYEQKLSDTIGIDCTKQPTDFHNSLVQARSLRSKVHDDVVKLNQRITDYQTTLNTFASTYNGGSQ